MLKRDFILVQIEELAKVITQIISQRNTDAARKIPQLVQGVYNSLKIDREFIMEASLKDIRQALDEEDSGGLQRMEITAKLLVEEAYLYPDKQRDIRTKAKEMLEYIQLHDITFSLERIQMLEELKLQLEG
ncbi:Tfp pilus assembly pilus retraction ATPase PilT [Parabacteroides sp. PF5-5]|uniref:hypothetical protein n=1 Tax=unclassified Parabacteroides TaxID=2649774 RepID=UPI0024759875|nr:MULTISPECIES: hypothetical protein [unclassified Parabacteroides]MDH6303912.1 Tfp pilus assembly pilus retraction ATPase PilT [Parabacteroides sp. PH5-39]MDH6314529.1 Tfp pilus assembly pilus retraction ATPase PilT [Parabacteroides sp. PF5-13]MDH6318406.1 Tfp pilus assembly pilus retraction ATPase PilT [Parabacteroides sp. PH5-13]MDH6322301.1 Tfp pilus assembly pilus retraction ATPase PilT [Parabacteroides sp. PH5-8]MDH6325619.1 Tfp pilus assembly pilus retraction ATPase PilT [Parabacteroid